MRTRALAFPALPLVVLLGSLVSCRADRAFESVKRGLEAKPDSHAIGVWASTESGLIELLTYGTQSLNLFNETYSYQFDECARLPRAESVQAIFVNIPDAKVTESKLFGLFDLAAQWHLHGNPADPRQVAPSMEIVEGSLYRLSSKEISTATSNFVAVSISMPMGTADRLYAIRIGKATAPVQPATPCIEGSVVGSEVLVSDEGLTVQLSGNQDGGSPFYGPGHNGEINWDIRIGDRLRVIGDVFPLDENSKNMYPGAPGYAPTHGILAKKITILSRKL
jgi:hypothetical protein